MNNSFYKADLHVHTPASRCYKGELSDNSYWQILKSAVEKDIKVIAITDHNTFDGYDHFMKLKSETFSEYDIIKKYNIPDEEMQDIQERVNLFNQVTILLGVEISLNPGVHIIVLCDEKEKCELSDLLDEIGFTSETRGSDEDITPNMDVKAFLENPKLEGKIVIAPHVDSTKGIWNELNGRYREEIFKSNQIAAITCNSASQLANIQQLVCSQPGYIRKKPFAYINASDAHEPEKIGSKYSFIKLNDFSYSEIKKALESPEEYVSDTDNPGFSEFVEKCAKSNPTIHLNNVEELPKALCAVLNNGYGCVLIGVKKNNALLGLAIDEEEMTNEIINSLQRLVAINHRRNSIEYSSKIEKLGNGKCVAVILVKYEGSRLWIFDDNESFILDTISEYKQATVKEIEALVRQHLLSDLKNFNSRNEGIVQDAVSKIKQVINPISKYTLYDKIKAVSLPISYYFDVQPIDFTGNDTPLTDTIYFNGHASGNVYYTEVFRPRLDNAYLRYSCPVYSIESEENISELYKFSSPSIVITLGGGCHIIDSNNPYYFANNSPAIVLIPNEQFFKNNLSIYHVIAWLKSNYSIWTCLKNSGDSNIYSPKIFKKLLLPAFPEFYQDTIIIEKVKRILEIEKTYLSSLNDYIDLYQDYPEDSKQRCDEHNTNVGIIAWEIEKYIKELLSIDDNEEVMIIEDLHAEHIFSYDGKVINNSENNPQLISPSN